MSEVNPAEVAGQTQNNPEVMPFPESASPGDEINWESDLAPVRLTVELPFWLLLPDGIIDLTLEGCMVRAGVVNDGIQVSLGHHESAGGAVLFKGSGKESLSAQVGLINVTRGGHSRLTKTLVTFEASAHSDAMQALNAQGRRHQQGLQYFRSLCVAHLDFLNVLVQSYRRLSSDPFATSLSAWDVPVWLLSTDRIKLNIILFGYFATDRRPSAGKVSELPKMEPILAATLEEVGQIAAGEPVPGEMELLDGLSLYYRGRYEDSIRSFVTAIEVLLEARVRDLLREAGAAPKAVEQILFDTRMDFNARLEIYCDLAKSRVPGPYLSVFPMFNGVRLAEELQATRKLRHEIVHAGRRVVDDELERPMERIADTMTWLFDWMSLNKRACRGKKLPKFFYNLGMSKMFFDHRLEPDKLVLIRPLAGIAEPQGEDATDIITSRHPGSISAGRFLRALGGGGRPIDLELFTIMALAKFGFQCRDCPPLSGSPLPHPGRYFFDIGDEVTLVFPLDLQNVVTERDLEQIAAAVGVRMRQGAPVVSVLVVINDQNGLTFEVREPDTISPECLAMAESCGLGLVRTGDLARLALAVREYSWPGRANVEELVKPGWNGLTPAGALEIGTTQHFYTNHSTVSIELNGSVTISQGDFLALRLRKRFFQMRITSMQQNRVQVEQARIGRVGIVVDLQRNDVPIGWDVFLLPKPDEPGEAEAAQIAEPKAVDPGLDQATA